MIFKDKLSIPRPDKDQVIMVYHGNIGSVPMIVLSHNGNLLECEHNGIEVCVRLGKVILNGEWVPRWESISN